MNDTPDSTVTYDPTCFDVTTVEQARRIILTPQGSTTDARWTLETPYQVALAADHLPLAEDSVLLDYGCGIGRLARELIAEFGCRVIGVDISASMRAMAAEYVGSERFLAVSSEELDRLLDDGLTCDGAYSVWVLQHCHKPAEDIARIHRTLRVGGAVLVVNNTTRAVPVADGFAHDGIDVKALLDASFARAAEGQPNAALTVDRLAANAFWFAGVRA